MSVLPAQGAARRSPAVELRAGPHPATSTPSARMNAMGSAPPGMPEILESRVRLTVTEVAERFPQGTPIRVVRIKGIPPLRGNVMNVFEKDGRPLVLVCCPVMRSGVADCFDFAVPPDYLRVIKGTPPE